jgi:hypothetical protein
MHAYTLTNTERFIHSKTHAHTFKYTKHTHIRIHVHTHTHSHHFYLENVGTKKSHALPKFRVHFSL